jgi:hypothetical protein
MGVAVCFTDEGSASMRAWKKTLLAAMAVGAFVATTDLASRSVFAAEPAQPPKAEVEAVSPEAPADREAPAALPDKPDQLDTVGAFAGGLLVLGLAAFGLTLTFWSLAKEIRGRRNRYRRRTRREQRNA